jgi:hypothetical protein
MSMVAKICQTFWFLFIYFQLAVIWTFPLRASIMELFLSLALNYRLHYGVLENLVSI